MRFFSRILWLGLLFFPLSAIAFLNDSDPSNFFTLLQQAPLILKVKLQETVNPTSQTRYFVHSLKVEAVLLGKSEEASVKVLQEMIFPKEVSAYPASVEALTLLAPLPNYTAYAAVKSQGVNYRLFGGSKGVFALTTEDGKELLPLVTEYLKARQTLQGSAQLESFKTLTLKAMDLLDPLWLNEAARAMEELEIPRNFFSSEQVNQMVARVRDVRMKPAGQIALVKALKKSAMGPSLDALQKLAEGNSSPAKWAAIRALSELGFPRSTEKMISDFNEADPAGKEKALALLVKQQDEASKIFLKQLLSSSDTLEIKREAIDSMARMGGVEFEKILLEQLDRKDEQVSAQAMLALGRMQSREAVPRLIQLLESPSPLLRNAAMMGLEQSNDPRASKVVQEKTDEGGTGHTH